MGVGFRVEEGLGFKVYYYYIYIYIFFFFGGGGVYGCMGVWVFVEDLAACWAEGCEKEKERESPCSGKSVRTLTRFVLRSLGYRVGAKELRD